MFASPFSVLSMLANPKLAGKNDQILGMGYRNLPNGLWLVVISESETVEPWKHHRVTKKRTATLHGLLRHALVQLKGQPCADLRFPFQRLPWEQRLSLAFWLGTGHRPWAVLKDAERKTTSCQHQKSCCSKSLPGWRSKEGSCKSQWNLLNWNGSEHDLITVPKRISDLRVWSFWVMLSHAIIQPSKSYQGSISIEA